MERFYSATKGKWDSKSCVLSIPSKPGPMSTAHGAVHGNILMHTFKCIAYCSFTIQEYEYCHLCEEGHIVKTVLSNAALRSYPSVAMVSLIACLLLIFFFFLPSLCLISSMWLWSSCSSTLDSEIWLTLANRMKQKWQHSTSKTKFKRPGIFPVTPSALPSWEEPAPDRLLVQGSRETRGVVRQQSPACITCPPTETLQQK